MRRARRRLQVDTFPFLAVLLGIMGSLILVLLVMDRRAKRVARARALQVVAQAEQEDSQAAARRAEWERRRRELQERLLQEDRQLRAQLQSLLHQTTAVSAQTGHHHEQADHLRQQLQSERANLSALEADIQASRQRHAEKANHAAARQTEITRMAAEMEQQERTLLEIQAARRLAQRNFSVVPYRGPRGDSRRPIYVECSAQGLVFHPDRRVMPRTDLSGVEIRAEVDRQLAAKKRAAPENGKRDEESAYLLLLVRPGGIIPYYHAMDALKGVSVALGYELIDDDWVLDFPEGEDGPAQPPMTASSVRPPAPGVVGTAPGAPGPGTNRPRGVVFGGGSEAEGSAEGAGGYGTGTGRPLTPGGGAAGKVGMSGPPGAGAPIPLASGSPLGTGGGGGEGRKPSVPGTAGQGDSPAPGVSVRPSAGTGNSVTPSGPELGPTPASSPGTTTPGMSRPPLPEGSGGTPGAPRPETQPETKEAGSAQGGTAQGGAKEGTASAAGGNSPGEPGEPGERAGPLDTPGRSETKPVPRPVRLAGNRDWIIQVECTAGTVVLHPTRLRFPTTALVTARGKDNPLLQAIEQTIARRQTAVRPGEAPYRPQIRFLVRPDGLRAFHLAYPALEQLRLPMTRQDVDRNEDVGLR